MIHFQIKPVPLIDVALPGPTDNEWEDGDERYYITNPTSMSRKPLTIPNTGNDDFY